MSRVHFMKNEAETLCGRPLHHRIAGRTFASGGLRDTVILVTQDIRDTDCRRCMKEMAG